MKSKAEIAEAIYQKARAQTPAKTPDSITDLNTYTQKRYLIFAEAVIELMGDEAPAEPQPTTRIHSVVYPAELLDLLAEQLAYKLLNPQHFNEKARDAFDMYVEEVGVANVPALVREAIDKL